MVSLYNCKLSMLSAIFFQPAISTSSRGAYNRGMSCTEHSLNLGTGDTTSTLFDS